MQPYIVIVCLPADGATPDTTARAGAVLVRHQWPVHAGTVRHFAVASRRDTALIDRHGRMAAGGPIRLLDLAGMRTRAQQAASARWQVWRQVVAGTPTARPFWHFVQRHGDNPNRYPLAQAQQDYLAQPRLLAMAAHNAVPGQPCPLPTGELEALQTGGPAYATLGWLQAVPTDALCTSDHWCTPTSGRLADVTGYLAAVNRWLDTAARDLILLAVAVPARD